MDCIACGREGKIGFRALTVETLAVRDLKGEKKVQALREEAEFAICEGCAKAALARARHPERQMLAKILLFSAFLLCGAALTVIFWRSNGALRLMGLAAIFLGVVGVLSSVKTLRERQEEYSVLSDADALQRAAWEAVLAKAPKKRGDSDLTYIPVTAETRARKNGDLMILYHLLPAIAVEAYDRLHPQPEAGENTGPGGNPARM